MPEEELDDIIDEIDADGSGTVDFEGKIKTLNSNQIVSVIINYCLAFIFRIHGGYDR